MINRIPAKHIGHDLSKALEFTHQLPFKISFSRSSRDFIKHIDTFGRFRYLEGSFYVTGPKLIELDKTVWEIRRYCKSINYEIRLNDGYMRNMLELELKRIELSEQESPNKFRLFGGYLEKVVIDKNHPARRPLIWQNAFFGSSSRSRITMRVPNSATNAPLSLHPEILDEIIKYVHLPKEIIFAYRSEITKRSRAKRL